MNFSYIFSVKFILRDILYFFIGCEHISKHGDKVYLALMLFYCLYTMIRVQVSWQKASGFRILLKVKSLLIDLPHGYKRYQQNLNWSTVLFNRWKVVEEWWWGCGKVFLIRLDSTSESIKINLTFFDLPFIGHRPSKNMAVHTFCDRFPKVKVQSTEKNLPSGPALVSQW